jgi:serine/threonine protein kinase
MNVIPADKPEHTFTGKVVLGRYHVILPLAKGGQGVVHLARAEGAAGVARPVVIKRVLGPLAGDKQARARFVREARITARLRHPDIVSIVEFERESDDSYLMVLEYVHGYDLWRWARFVQLMRGELPAHLVAYVGTRVLDALHYSHSQRNPDGAPTPVIHGDVSGGNVLIDVTGQIKLTDFGIAAVAAKGRDNDGHEQGLQGKLGYIAPELFRGALSSPASDIYACGVLLHTLLAGNNEFQAPDVESAEARALRHVATPLDSVRDDVSSAAAQVIERALAKDPEARFQSAAAFAGELRRAFALDLAETREEFARVVERDFEDPSFAEKMNVRSLRQIDAAWRRQDTDVPSDSLMPLRSSSPSHFPLARPSMQPTRHESMKAHGPAEPAAVHQIGDSARAGRRRLELLGWSAALSLLVALLIVMVVTRLGPSDDARVVYVEAQPVAAGVRDTASARDVQETASAAAEAPLAEGQRPSAEAPSTATNRRPAVHENQLTERFARRRAEVSQCFRGHALAAPAQLSIAFEVDPGGRVQRAELEPSALRESALGACLLRVAESTQFGAQRGYLRFHIPVNAHSHDRR